MKILLTNDDSADSPLLDLAVRHLKKRGNVKVVVPKEEQSWKAKSITRFEPMTAETLPMDGVSAFAFNGTPADCTNFGIYHLYEDGKPDLVVAGINMGANTGLAFTASSGTVGACLEANLAGLPAVALSQTLDSKLFRSWIDHRQVSEEVMAKLGEQTEQVLTRVFDVLLQQEGFLDRPLTWNVNVPPQTRRDWQLVPTYLGHVFYTSCFQKDGDVYRHNIESPAPDTNEGSDTAIVMGGDVSVTKLDLMVLGQDRDGLAF